MSIEKQSRGVYNPIISKGRLDRQYEGDREVYKQDLDQDTIENRKMFVDSLAKEVDGLQRSCDYDEVAKITITDKDEEAMEVIFGLSYTEPKLIIRINDISCNPVKDLTMNQVMLFRNKVREKIEKRLAERSKKETEEQAERKLAEQKHEERRKHIIEKFPTKELPGEAREIKDTEIKEVYINQVREKYQRLSNLKRQLTDLGGEDWGYGNWGPLKLGTSAQDEQDESFQITPDTWYSGSRKNKGMMLYIDDHHFNLNKFEPGQIYNIIGLLDDQIQTTEDKVNKAQEKAIKLEKKLAEQEKERKKVLDNKKRQILAALPE